MNIKLNSISLENFKGCKSRTVQFSDDITEICGANATGKTTIVDAFLWCLFNKDSSGNTSFGIRPVDETGTDIDNIDISVEVVLTADGKETSFKKIQKQKWTKHRGKDTPTYEGNVNSYEISGFPATEKEYKARIAEIVSEDRFKLISDLRYFSSLKWEEKKKILLELIGDISDEDVISSDPKWEPIADDVLAAGAEKARDKAKKSIRDLNIKQRELPVRIDEVRKQRKDIPDTEELVRVQNDLTAKIAEAHAELDTAKNDGSQDNLRKRKAEIEAKMSEMKSAAKQELFERESELSEKMVKARHAMQNVLDKRSKLNTEISGYENQAASLKAKLDDWGKKYREAQDRKFDEKSTYCKSCGQILPKDRIDKIRTAFSDLQNHDMDTAKANGFEIKSSIETLQSQIELKKSELEQVNEESAQASENYRQAKEEHDSLNMTIDMSGNADYAKLEKELEKINAKLSKAQEKSAAVSAAEERIAELDKRLSEVTRLIGEADSIRKQNDDIDSRVLELENELKDNGQKLALCEQKVILLEEYSVTKAEMLSEKITDAFEQTRFSMFSKQINGGLVEQCEITLNGVKYKDMNSGHRIVCALDVIKTFQKKLGITCPVFVDNAESINEFNLPEMPGQLILLRVTDDKELRVVEE